MITFHHEHPPAIGLAGFDHIVHKPHTQQTAVGVGELLKSDTLRIVVAFDRSSALAWRTKSGTSDFRRLKEANEILQKAQEAVGKISGELPTELIEGSPAEAIINVAKIRGSRVIVMGSRGLSSIAELMLGSTGHKVVIHASCLVLIGRQKVFRLLHLRAVIRCFNGRSAKIGVAKQLNQYE